MFNFIDNMYAIIINMHVILLVFLCYTPSVSLFSEYQYNVQAICSLVYEGHLYRAPLVHTRVLSRNVLLACCACICRQLHKLPVTRNFKRQTNAGILFKMTKSISNK